MCATTTKSLEEYDVPSTALPKGDPQYDRIQRLATTILASRTVIDDAEERRRKAEAELIPLMEAVGMTGVVFPNGARVRRKVRTSFEFAGDHTPSLPYAEAALRLGEEWARRAATVSASAVAEGCATEEELARAGIGLKRSTYVTSHLPPGGEGSP